MKKYEAYKNSGIEWIGEIPENWSVIPMKHYFYMKGRIGWQGLKADEFIEEGPFLVTGTDFANGKVCWDRCYHISEERYNEAPEIHVQKGDLLITKDGTVGKLALIDEKPEKVSLNSHLLILRPTKEGIDNHFVYWALQSVNFKDYTGLASSGSTMASLSQEKIGEYPLLLPSTAEQQAIASYLDHKVGQIDASISAINTQIDDLKAYRQSIISEAVTKGVDPNASMKDSGVEWIGEIPENWSVVPLKHYLSLKGRIGWNGLKSEEFQEKSYAYLVTGQDFNSDVVNWEKCYQINKERYDEDPFIQLENGDLLVTKDGTIGKVAKVVNLDKPACLNSGIFVVKQTKGVFEQNYLYWVLVSNQLKEFVGFNSTGSTIAHLYQNVFENMPLTVPSLVEQKSIASFLDSKTSKIDSAISSLEAQRDDLYALKQSIISEAVTGKIDVRDWTDNNV